MAAHSIESDGSGLHVVFVEPEIPPNTGTTARLCAATRTPFHLVGPLGFSLEDRYLRRAGLDYWPHVELYTYETWADFLERRDESRLLLFSTKGTVSHTAVRYRCGDHLVFGGETRGLPAELLARGDPVVRIPMTGPVRSLNLANAAAIGLYEGLRQLDRT